MAMKKIMAAVFSVMLAVGVLAGCSGNSGTNNTTNSTNSTGGSGSGQTETKSGLLSTAYADIMKSGKYFMHYTTSTTMEGKTINSDIQMATDGGNTYFLFDTDGMKVHQIIKGDTAYILNDDSKTYFKIAISSNDSGTTSSVKDKKIDTTGMVFLSKGRAELNGKTLDYEEYKTDYGTIRYYFDSGKLYAVVFKSDDIETTMIILELSGNVTAEMFEIPSDYKEATTAY